MTEMTPRERLLGAIRGKEIDRTPWSPFLAYYFEHLPYEVQLKGQLDYMERMGADPLLRGFHTLYQFERKNVIRRTVKTSSTETVFYETPVGSLTEIYTYSPSANSWFLTGHPVKTEEDFKILQYIYEHTSVIPDYKAFDAEEKIIQHRGLSIPCVHKTSFQDLLERWCGTINLVYALADFPETVEECLSHMQALGMECLIISADHPTAEGIISWEDTSTTNINPTMFSRYIGSELSRWTKELHSKGKFYLHHACGHLKDLLPLMAETGIDMVESISPPPTGNIEIRDAVKLLPDHIGIIGGIEPTFFRNCDKTSLRECVYDLQNAMKGKRFILANSDSCPPDVSYEMMLYVGELVREIR